MRDHIVTPLFGPSFSQFAALLLSGNGRSDASWRETDGLTRHVLAQIVPFDAEPEETVSRSRSGTGPFAAAAACLFGSEAVASRSVPPLSRALTMFHCQIRRQSGAELASKRPPISPRHNWASVGLPRSGKCRPYQPPTRPGWLHCAGRHARPRIRPSLPRKQAPWTIKTRHGQVSRRQGRPSFPWWSGGWTDGNTVL